MIIPLIVLAVVFFLIAVRQVGNVKLQIWQIMLGGAIIVLATGSISPADAFRAINFDVIFFLFGMFVIGQSLDDSGYLSHLAFKLFRKARSVDHIVLLILFGMGMASAILMNDTLAIIGTPVVLYISRKHDISAKLLLLCLAFSVTLGSVMSPIGNPQNLLIAFQFQNPFAVFLRYLFLPTLINLFLTYLVLKLFFNKEFTQKALHHKEEPIKDRTLASLSKLSLFLVISLIITKVFFVAMNIDLDFRLTYIALASSLPILIYRFYCFMAGKEFHIMMKIDWYTLVFFISMFVLMKSVWETGLFQTAIADYGLDIKSIPVIFGISVLLSQVISNVPLVALYLPLLTTASATSKELMALAAGSTVAGNLLILGAASNVIIIQNAEKKGETISFMDFAKIGIILTAANVLVYWISIII